MHRKKKEWFFWICIFLLCILLFLSIFPQIVAKDPYFQDLNRAFHPPDSSFFLGCDALGRDVFARLVYGTRYSLSVGVLVSTLSLVFPLFTFWLLFLSPRLFTMVFMGIIDIFLVFPPLLIAILIASRSTEDNFFNVVMALFLSGWATNARLIRAWIVGLESREFVLAARSMGACESRIFLIHLLPNLYSSLLVLWTFRIGAMILAEATLSFLGLGGGPQSLSWGWQVYHGRTWFMSHPLLSLWPAMAIALCVGIFEGIGNSISKKLQT